MSKAGIIGASGYAGGEILRLLLNHPEVEITAATSKHNAGEYISRVHPNLKGYTNLKFTDETPMDVAAKVDILFLAVPHGSSVKITPQLVETGTRIIDMSADFRLKDSSQYPVWYGWEHPAPDLLQKFTYGMPELHRDEIRNSRLIAVPGCIASSSIYSLAPLAKSGLLTGITVIDAKIGSSGSGNKSTSATHFSERFNSVRIYSPSDHRHIGEIEQELSIAAAKRVTVTMSAHSVNMVRGILTTSSIFTEHRPAETDLWKAYRSMYRNEPFIRFMMDPNGLFRYPDPKLVIGSNFVDLGFAIDRHVNRVVAIGAIDNLIKGAAGNAIQSMNIMMGYPENAGLNSAPLRLV
ncbi:MAG: N-acetyl-gamma-glutamyl-phosphate reductase [Candidatus Thermoplasmatota archaeon]|nr:N-acetyl-gamma-glutamyl-phosphate reductase [Candidatus Thermoplasmatota archaeon]